jgi:hypothetical protein
MADEWRKLIKRYANGKPLCNCDEAYYTPCGKGYDETGARRDDMLACEWGCQANQHAVKDYIAGQVLTELKKLGAS